jgi:branched-chain amino acid transport system substrate-binding protein
MLGDRLKRLRMLLVAGTLCACSRDSATYTIASASPWNEAYGLMSRQGTELAVDAINKRGGVRSHLLTLVRVDDEGTGTKAAAVAQDLVDTDSVLAVVGHANSSATVAAARVYDGRLAAVSPSASSPEITGLCPGSSGSFRATRPTGRTWRASRAALGHKQAAILYENNTMDAGSPMRSGVRFRGRGRIARARRGRRQGSRAVPRISQAPRTWPHLRGGERRIGPRDPA